MFELGHDRNALTAMRQFREHLATPRDASHRALAVKMHPWSVCICMLRYDPSCRSCELKCFPAHAADAAINTAHIHAITLEWRDACAWYVDTLRFVSTNAVEWPVHSLLLEPISRSDMFKWLSRTHLGLNDALRALRSVLSSIHLTPECYALWRDMALL